MMSARLFRVFVVLAVIVFWHQASARRTQERIDAADKADLESYYTCKLGNVELTRTCQQIWLVNMGKERK